MLHRSLQALDTAKLLLDRARQVKATTHTQLEQVVGSLLPRDMTDPAPNPATTLFSALWNESVRSGKMHNSSLRDRYGVQHDYVQSQPLRPGRMSGIPARWSGLQDSQEEVPVEAIQRGWMLAASESQGTRRMNGAPEVVRQLISSAVEVSDSRRAAQSRAQNTQFWLCNGV